MILDIDHISFSSMILENDIEIIKKLGYKVDFFQKQVQNLDIKKCFLKNFSDFHDIALLKLSNSYNIELVHNNNCFRCIPYMVPIFENLPNNLTNEKEFNNEIEYNLKFLDIPIITKNNHTKLDFIFNNLIIYTRNCKKTREFFELFGFIHNESADGKIRLEFNSLFNNKKYFLLLEKRHDNSLKYLDDIGPNCISFITNSIEREKKSLEKKGFFTTRIQELKLNDKLINIFFVRGPGNEIVEIISIKKNNEGILNTKTNMVCD